MDFLHFVLAPVIFSSYAYYIRTTEIVVFTAAFFDFVFRTAIMDDVITSWLINGRGHTLVCG